MAASTRIYSEEDDIILLSRELYTLYSHDTRNIYKIIHKLIDRLMYDPQFNHHYNKYHIIIATLERFYEKTAHGKEIVRSYTAYVSDELHRLKQEKKEQEQEKEQRRRSFYCRYCIIS